MRKKLLVVAGAAAIAAATAGGVFAYASVPDGGGTITACYPTAAAQTGAPAQLLIVDTATGHCPAGFSTLTWAQQGAPGPTGPQGPAGPQGPPGPTGAKQTFKQVTGTPLDIAGGDTGLAEADCAPGTTVTGGGWFATAMHGSIAYEVSVGESRPSAQGWLVNAHNTYTDHVILTAYAICASG